MHTSGGLPHGDKSERMQNILEEKLIEKTKTLMYFDSNVNRDGMEEGNSLRQ